MIFEVYVFMFILLPLVLMRYCHRLILTRWLGSIIVAYFLGFIIGQIIDLELYHKKLELISGVSILIAIPLLLSKTNILRWIRKSKHSFIALGLACLATILSILSTRIFIQPFHDYNKVLGMLTGVYIGGTPNAASIGLALDVSNETFVLVNTSDVIVSGIYLLILMRFLKPILSKFLKQAYATKPTEVHQYSTVTNQVRSKSILINILFSFILLGISFGISYLILGLITTVSKTDTPNSFEDVMIIVSITTLSFGFSFIPKVRNLKHTEITSDYFILLFCVIIGSMIQPKALLEANQFIFIITLYVVVATILLYYLFCYLFQIDIDTAMAVSVATVFSPPFVGILRKQVSNESALVSGYTVGIIGYGIGNYLGIAMSMILA